MNRIERKQRKPDRLIPTQTPGVVVNRAEQHPADVLMEQAFQQPNTTRYNLSQPTTTQPVATQDNLSPQHTGAAHNNQLRSAAPDKDFTKYANSLLRKSPQLFKGLSKQTYDALYKRTRGAIVPTRTIQLTKSQLCAAAGLHANTVLKHINHLKEVGLITVEYQIGKHEGSIYEIFVPEELNLAPEETNLVQNTANQPTTTHHNPPHTRHHNPPQKLLPHTIHNVGWVVVGNTIENKGVNDDPKTFFKTKYIIDDDEAARTPLEKFAEVVDTAFREMTGRGIDETDAQSFAEIAAILVNELREARTKTKSISKPAAFLAQHLRARLATPVRSSKAQTVGAALVGKPSEPAPEKPIDLSNYTPEELAEFEKVFCLTCGRRHEECSCAKTSRFR